MSLFSIQPDQTHAWAALRKHFDTLSTQRIDALFKDNPKRATQMSIKFEDLLFDYSKNKVTAQTIQLFGDLAKECFLKENIQQMWAGQPINKTENRAVLHVALRNSTPQQFFVQQHNVDEDVQAVLDKMGAFCHRIHNGQHLGYTHKKIKYIVNIGIGGSDLGPCMATAALKPFWLQGTETHFVSNVDAAHINEVLKLITPDETLFIIASKTFTTQETLTNAHTARAWFLTHAKDEAHIAQHFIALSTNEKEVVKFGIHPDNMFEFWDWVGGRYSIWSSIGISIALTIGFDNFKQFLRGAESIDQHFVHTPWDKNIPFILGALEIWHTNFHRYTSHCIMPYNQYLQKFPAYLQQAEMESNGKYVDRNHKPITYKTAPVIWGDAGTNGQHSFFQLLHQGTDIIPCDFIVAAHTHQPTSDHHEKLLANCFAQSAALMIGKPYAKVVAELNAKKTLHVEDIAAFKVFEGDRPSTTFLFKDINPYTLGQLIAIYEHKILVQGLLLNIYSFDQFGVELGKELCNTILPDVQSQDPVHQFDASTNMLLNETKAMRS